MNYYEIVYVVHPALQAGHLDDTVNQINKKVAELGGEVLYCDNWGKKKLSYLIQKQKYGTYILFQCKISGKNIDQISSEFEHNTNILRHLVGKITEEEILESKVTEDVAGEKENKPEEVAGEKENKPEEVAGEKENKPEEVAGEKENKPEEVAGEKENKPEEVAGEKENKPEEVAGEKENKPEEVAGEKENKPEEVAGEKENKPEEVAGEKENKPEEVAGENDNIDGEE